MVSRIKNNRILWISLILIIIATFSYVIGYERFVNKYSKDFNRQTYRYTESYKASKDKEGSIDADVSAHNEVKEASVVKEEKISNKTKYTCIERNIVTGKVNRISKNVPIHFVGLNKMQLDKYYDYYMTNMPTEEMGKGLIDINIINFSNNEVMVEKIYDITTVVYYITESDGYVKVYYADKETLYENTGIMIEELPEIEQKSIEKGMFIKDKDELISILEGYSS